MKCLLHVVIDLKIYILIPHLSSHLYYLNKCEDFFIFMFCLAFLYFGNKQCQVLFTFIDIKSRDILWDIDTDFVLVYRKLAEMLMLNGQSFYVVPLQCSLIYQVNPKTRYWYLHFNITATFFSHQREGEHHITGSDSQWALEACSHG